MIPSSEEVAANVRKHITAMAQAIADRVDRQHGPDGIPETLREDIAQQAALVLLDWFLGDWLAGDK